MKNTVPTEVPQDTAAVASLVASIEAERYSTVIRLVTDPKTWVPNRCVVCADEARPALRLVEASLCRRGEAYVTADVHAGGDCLFSFGLFVTGWTRVDVARFVVMGG